MSRRSCVGPAARGRRARLHRLLPPVLVACAAASRASQGTRGTPVAAADDEAAAIIKRRSDSSVVSAEQTRNAASPASATAVVHGGEAGNPYVAKGGAGDGLASSGGHRNDASGRRRLEGASECPCLATSPLTGTMFAVDKAGVPVVRALPGGRDSENPAGAFYYAADYGVGCATHDERLPPMCATATKTSLENNFPHSGSPRGGSPPFCAKQWCWVDPQNCGGGSASALKYFPIKSGFFVADTLAALPGAVTSAGPIGGDDFAYYSYKTCAKDRSIDSQVGTATDMIRLVERYARARSSTPANFNEVGTILRAGSADGDRFRCREQLVRDLFLRVAGAEYDVAERTTSSAGMYMGFQESGNYIAWPLSKPPSCKVDGTSTFDPRFRPWYATVASGPKDVLLVIDLSGSMNRYARIELAKEAAKAVLDTLTWVDFVNVMSFSSKVRSAADVLIPATDENRARLREWIEGMEPAGTTNYRDALREGMEMLKRARTTRNCWSAFCSSSLLFLSDGKPDNWEPDVDYGLVAAQNAECSNCIRLFTYGLGRSLNTEVLLQLAIQNRGQMALVEDGGTLKDEMSQYYTYLVQNRDTELVRWIRYADANSGEELAAACVAIDDPRQQAGKKEKLFGVWCMDLDMLGTREELQRKAGYLDFLRAYERTSRTCEEPKPQWIPLKFTISEADYRLTPFRAQQRFKCDDTWGSAADRVCAAGANCLGSPPAGLLAAEFGQDADKGEEEEDAGGGGYVSPIVVPIGMLFLALRFRKQIKEKFCAKKVPDPVPTAATTSPSANMSNVVVAHRVVNNDNRVAQRKNSLCKPGQEVVTVTFGADDFVDE
eukprot:gene284-4_t